MARRSLTAKADHLEPVVMRSASRLKSRIAALLEGALDVSGLTQTEIAERLGIRKSAVGKVLHGSGNVTIETLAEYLAAMGYEADVTVVRQGEILRAMSEHRSPECLPLTLMDHSRRSNTIVVQPRRQSGNQPAGRSVQMRYSVGGTAEPVERAPHTAPMNGALA